MAREIKRLGMNSVLENMKGYMCKDKYIIAKKNTSREKGMCTIVFCKVQLELKRLQEGVRFFRDTHEFRFYFFFEY